MSCPLPEAKRPAIDRALMATFGTSELDGAAQPVSGGLSGAGVWRIRVGGIAYLLRIESARDEFRDPVRHYECLRTAAANFLAPRVRYAEPADGVAIVDFIAPHSLAQDYPGAGHALVIELARAIRVLHETPPFPPLVDYLDGMDNLLALHRGLDILEPEATAELFERYGKLRARYRTVPGDLVSSHNDLNPGNILYDGQRLWLVDWEAAFRADRYVDLATAGNWFTGDAGGEEALLTTYFGRAPDAEEGARFHLMRLVNHLFIGAIFLNVAMTERPGARLDDRTLAGPSLEALRQRLKAGEFDMMAWDNRIIYGKARLAAALEGLRDTACAAALAVLPPQLLSDRSLVSGSRNRVTTTEISVKAKGYQRPA
jgi:aminoglycoside phosphotransferase